MTVIGIAYAIFPGLTISAAVPSIVQDKKNQIRLPVGTNQLEKVLQGPSGSEEVYTMPFTKESKIDLWSAAKWFSKFCRKARGLRWSKASKDVNSQKRLELFQKDFDYLFNAEYVPKEVKAEMRQEAVAQGLIGGNISDYDQQQSTSRTQAPKNTYH